MGGQPANTSSLHWKLLHVCSHLSFPTTSFCSRRARCVRQHAAVPLAISGGAGWAVGFALQSPFPPCSRKMRPFLMRPGSLSVSALLAASALFRHGPPEGHAGATWALCRLPLQWIPQVPLQWPAGPVPSVLDGLSQSRLHLTVSAI